MPNVDKSRQREGVKVHIFQTYFMDGPSSTACY